MIREETKELAACRRALSFVNYFLLAFGFIALIDGHVHHLQHILDDRRATAPELALLRAIGADRRQIRRSVLSKPG